MRATKVRALTDAGGAERFRQSQLRKLPTLEASVRIIYGENDRALPDVAKTMRRVKQAHPLAEVTPLPNCGHFLQEDEPERLGQLMAEFLNSAPR